MVRLSSIAILAGIALILVPIPPVTTIPGIIALLVGIAGRLLGL